MLQRMPWKGRGTKGRREGEGGRGEGGQPDPSPWGFHGREGGEGGQEGGQPDPSPWGFHAIYAEPKASDSSRCSQSERVTGLLAGGAATECHESHCPLRTPLDDVSWVPHTGTACPSGTCREARLESNRRNPVSAKAKRRGDGSGCPLSLSPFHLQVRRTQRAGIETVLPKMSAPRQTAVPVLRIPAMHPLQHRRQLGPVNGHQNEVDVVAHQAVSEDRQLRQTGLLAQQTKVHATVHARAENRLARAPALRNMVCHTGHDEPRKSRHLSQSVPRMPRKSLTKPQRDTSGRPLSPFLLSLSPVETQSLIFGCSSLRILRTRSRRAGLCEADTVSATLFLKKIETHPIVVIGEYTNCWSGRQYGTTDQDRQV